MTRISGCSDGTRNLLDILREEGCRIHADCGGRGTCGKCRVRFLSDAPEPGEAEKEKLSAEALREGFRLACLTMVTGDFTVETDDTEEAMDVASIEDSGADDIPSDPVVALDIGTTTLAAALLDPDKRKVIKTAVQVNHQRSFGADVISRIQASNQGKGDALKRLVREDIRNLLTRLGVGDHVPVIISANTTMQHLWQGLSCETLGVAPYTPVDLSCRTIDGCTLLPGISTYVGADIVSGIVAVGMDRAEKPCILIDLGTNGEIAVGCRNRILTASTAAGPAFEGGNISCGIAGVPGAVCSITIENKTERCETIGGLAPTGLPDTCEATENPASTGQSESPLKKHVWTGECETIGGLTPTGLPDTCEATENPASTCQAEKPRKRQAWSVNYETIGGLAPTGLCGTGVIEIVYELLKEGLLDETGLLDESVGEDGFVIADHVVFTQKDVREVQLAKSAIRAGLETLLDACGIGYEDVGVLYLAGGFGMKIDLHKACGIGLLPEELLDRTQAVGNTSLKGAALFAFDEEIRKRFLAVASDSVEVNLAESSFFQKEYMERMLFDAEVT